MGIVLYVLGGIVLFFLWLVFGTNNLCPNCGVDLTIDHDGPISAGVRDSCMCGWRRR